MLDFLKSENIERFAFCDFREAKIINERKLGALKKSWGCDPETVMVFLAPYYMGPGEEGNISVYARSRDYHLFFAGFYDRLREYLSLRGDASGFMGFCDNSPVDEVDLAVRSGLGVRGDNGLVIDRVYGSYIFIGEVFFKKDPGYTKSDMRRQGSCLHCGACVKACPVKCCGTNDRSLCLSYLSQKKKLEKNEEELVIKHRALWGCDICQSVCPLNAAARTTPLEFFSSDRTPFLTEELLDSLIGSGVFEKRAFAWRGPDVVRRNLILTKPR